MTTTRDQAAEAEANMGAIHEAVQTFGATITGAVHELAAIAISDADQETRVRLVKEFAAEWEQAAEG